MLVKDILPAPRARYPVNLTNVGGTLFFRADDGAERPTSCGDATGRPRAPTLVKDIHPGGATHAVPPSQFANWAGRSSSSPTDGTKGASVEDVTARRRHRARQGYLT